MFIVLTPVFPSIRLLVTYPQLRARMSPLVNFSNQSGGIPLIRFWMVRGLSGRSLPLVDFDSVCCLFTFLHFYFY